MVEKDKAPYKKNPNKFYFQSFSFFIILYHPRLIFNSTSNVSKKDINGVFFVIRFIAAQTTEWLFPYVVLGAKLGSWGSGILGQTDESDPCYNQKIDEATTFEYDEIDLVNMKIKELDRYFSRIIRNAVKRYLTKFL